MAGRLSHVGARFHSMGGLWAIPLWRARCGGRRAQGGYP